MELRNWLSERDLGREKFLPPNSQKNAKSAKVNRRFMSETPAPLCSVIPCEISDVAVTNLIPLVATGAGIAGRTVPIKEAGAAVTAVGE